MSPEVSDMFSKVDSSKSTYMKTKKIGEHKKELGPRVVRLPEGVVPDYVKLTKYQEFCWRTIGQDWSRSGQSPTRSRSRCSFRRTCGCGRRSSSHTCG